MKRYLGLLCISFFLSGCFFLHPSEKAEFSDFLVHESPKIKPNFDNQREGDFAQKNFPGNCEWKKFERVVDGDTIVLENNVRVRFLGIDTPETKHPDKPIQKFGLEASKKTKEFLSDSKKVCLIVDQTSDYYDKYARRLAYVFSEEGVDVNAKLIRLGLAKPYVRFSFLRKKEFLFLESLAKKERLALWSD